MVHKDGVMVRLEALIQLESDGVPVSATGAQTDLDELLRPDGTAISRDALFFTVELINHPRYLSPACPQRLQLLELLVLMGEWVHLVRDAHCARDDQERERVHEETLCALVHAHEEYLHDADSDFAAQYAILISLVGSADRASALLQRAYQRETRLRVQMGILEALIAFLPRVTDRQEKKDLIGWLAVRCPVKIEQARSEAVPLSGYLHAATMDRAALERWLHSLKR